MILSINLIGLLEISFYQGSQGFQEDWFGYHDIQTYDWLETSYLEISIANNNLQSYLIFSKVQNIYEGTFTRSYQGMYDWFSS